jgi:Ca-activated chloride channel family protein
VLLVTVTGRAAGVAVQGIVTVPVAGRNTAAVAEFGMLLHESTFKADATWADAVKLATAHRGEDPDGYRAEFVRLVELAAALNRQRTTSPSVSRR